MLKTFIKRIGELGVEAQDDDLLKNKKRFLMYQSVLMSMGGVLWGIICLAIDKPMPSLIPFGYIFLTFINVYRFLRVRKFFLAQSFQTLISLLLPFFLQWSLGGFYESGGVGIWALLALASSLSYTNKNNSLLWLLAFLLLSIFSGVFDAEFSVLFRTEEIQKPLAVALVLMNTTIVSLLIFVLIIFYVNENNASYVKVTAAQAIVGESAKLSVLGQLSAGIAHEINTPLGAIRALAEENSEVYKGFMERMRELCKNLSDEEFEAFTLLYNESENNLSPHSPKEAREIRKNLEASLDQIGIEKSHLIARKLQEIQINSFNDPLLTLSKSAKFKKIIELLNELKSLKINNAVINLSVDKASRTVKALKLFMHSEENETNESFSLRESIETILTIYSNELKKGIEVEFNAVNFNQLIRGHQDSINQVWANLIVNACQAMNFKGKLILNCEQIEGNFSLISIQDNGPGIPELIQPRIFSPFFSTKEKGIGSGVGLSIVQQIIKREGGEIWFESSELTGTTFFVKLKNVV